MITYENFAFLMNSIKKQLESDKEISYKIMDMFHNSYFIKDTVLIDDVVTFLKNEFNDADNWIEYFIYELDFGELATPESVLIDGECIPIANLSDLYLNFLVPNYIKKIRS
jgi:hypothetical protein